MYKFLITLCVVLSFSCKEEVVNKPIKTVKEIKPRIKPIKKKKPKADLITTENVVEKLTAYGKENPETLVLLTTTKGKIKIKLFKDTPLHRASFILHAKAGYFDDCIFSRVAPEFMAQAGGSYEDHQRKVQEKIGHYTIPSEMSKHHFHKKGAVASARSYTNNPKKRSDPDEFYMVDGSNFNEPTLEKYEYDNNYKYSKQQKDYYLKNKGAAHLDGQHTVFGQIIEGLSVITKITNVETDSRDWPYVDIHIEKIEVLK